MKLRLLFLAVVTPVAVLGRPVWRRRLGLDARTTETYWRKRTDAVTADSLKTRP